MQKRQARMHQVCRRPCIQKLPQVNASLKKSGWKPTQLTHASACCMRIQSARRHRIKHQFSAADHVVQGRTSPQPNKSNTKARLVKPTKLKETHKRSGTASNNTKAFCTGTLLRTCWTHPSVVGGRVPRRRRRLGREPPHTSGAHHPKRPNRPQKISKRSSSLWTRLTTPTWESLAGPTPRPETFRFHNGCETKEPPNQPRYEAHGNHGG